jgi:hypothetical protein
VRNRFKVINCSVQDLQTELNAASGDGWEIVEDVDYYFLSMAGRMATAVMARQEGEN